jgi:hypothetical protein
MYASMLNRSLKRGHITALLGLACVLLLCSALASGKAEPNPGVLPPQSSSHGQTYGEWAADWWTWVQSIPADINPVLDATGADAAVDQTGSVWFLAGSFSGDAERTVTIPTGKALFFPIINNIWVNFPTDPPMEGEYLQ